ncbi:MAG: low specificity L-threonine aldolase, partial [Gaiellaceae bacterium]
AAGIYALEHNIERLADDHSNARLIGERLSASPQVEIDLERLETNIVVFGLAPDAIDAPTLVLRAQERGVLVFAVGPRAVRAVTHLDVDRAACARAGEILADLASGR